MIKLDKIGKNKLLETGIIVLSALGFVFSIIFFLVKSQLIIFLTIDTIFFLIIFVLIWILIKDKASKIPVIIPEQKFDDDMNAGANEVTESMVAALAHEIKNPLNSIKGATLYLEDNYGNNANIKEFTHIIMAEIGRLDSYLNEFMSFSRGMKLKLQKSDIINLINGIIMLVKHNFATAINLKVKKSNIQEIFIDQEQIRQVVVNLLSNANDAVNGTKKPHIEVIIDADQKNVYITIKDNGTGIDKKDLNKIFTPFYTTKKDGMGIGLNISRTIIKRHGGEIIVKSIKNKGTSFIISIPIKNEGGIIAG